MHFLRRVIVVCIVISLGSCALFEGILSSPKVSITNVEVLSSQGFQPKFAVHLNILNPNSVPIPISGFSYVINLNGYELFSGATNDVPIIPAYSDVPVRVEVAANLMQSIGFMTQLLSGTISTLNYTIDAKVKVGGVFMPYDITEQGQVAFEQ